MPVVIGLGGNRWHGRHGRPEAVLRAAAEALADAGLEAVRLSRIRTTAPLGPRATDFIRTPAAVYDTRFAFDYYRLLPDTRLLWGGRISVRDRPPAAVERLLRRDLARVFPGLAGVRLDYAWSGLMSYARHEMPQLGQLAPGLWYAQAFGGQPRGCNEAPGYRQPCGDAPGNLARGLAQSGMRKCPDQE
ncbi:MAG: NAD(P)/FAD-dependent oxidoreductase, partial [Thermaurantiacus tibetensis]